MSDNEEREEIKLEIGSHNQVVILDKLFGPTVFADLKIVPDLDEGWVIYRRWVKTNEWIEWVSIPAQIDQEFSDDDLEG